MKGSGSSSSGLRTRCRYCSKSLLLARRLFSPRLKTASSAECSVSRSRQYQTNGPNRKGNTIKEGLLKYFSRSSTCPSISCRWRRRGCSSPDSPPPPPSPHRSRTSAQLSPDWKECVSLAVFLQHDDLLGEAAVVGKEILSDLSIFFQPLSRISRRLRGRGSREQGKVGK